MSNTARSNILARLRKVSPNVSAAVEMEAAALYLLAAKYHAQALAIFTASDHLLTGQACTAEERQTTFNDMITLALNTAIL